MHDIEYNPYLGSKELALLNKAVELFFGSDIYCKHGTTGLDGVCIDCCDDLYGGKLAKIIDFPTNRDTI